MTLKEAKELLTKEFVEIGFHKSTKPFVFDESRWIEHEKPSVLEALRVLSKGGYYISIGGHDYNMREKRLQKEYEENTKAPGSAENSIKEDLSGNKSIEHCGEPIPGSPLSAVEGIKLQWKDNKNTDKNPALKEAASQFNDALLDEQTKKIKRLGKEIIRLNKIIHKKNLKIAEKDEVITDLGKELKAQKDLVDHISKLRDSAKINLNLRMKECEKLKDELEEANNLVKEVRKCSKEYCEYGIAAEKMIQKLANIIVSKGLVPSDVFEKCRLWANGYRFNPQLPELSEEEEQKLNAAKLVGVDVAEEGADHFGVIVLCKDKENEEAAEELSKVLNDVIDRFLLFGGIITKEE